MIDVWAPLTDLLVKECQLSHVHNYMYMGTQYGRVYQYKHIGTRRYINIDRYGQCYGYQHGRYLLITRAQAIEHVHS